MSIVEKTYEVAERQQEELDPNFTEEDFKLWLNLFVLGQCIFDKHVGNEDPITHIHLCQSYKGNLGREKVACYIEELDPKEITFTGMYDGSDSSEEYAFQQIVGIILNNKFLTLDPLPKDFTEKLVASFKEKP